MDIDLDQSVPAHADYPEAPVVDGLHMLGPNIDQDHIETFLSQQAAKEAAHGTSDDKIGPEENLSNSLPAPSTAILLFSL